MRAPLQPLFSLAAAGVHDLKVASGGALLLAMEPEREAEQGQVPPQERGLPRQLVLRVLDLRDGALVKVRQGRDWWP